MSNAMAKRWRETEPERSPFVFVGKLNKKSKIGCGKITFIDFSHSSRSDVCMNQSQREHMSGKTMMKGN